MGLFDRSERKKTPAVSVQVSELLSGKGINFRRENDSLFKFEANVDERIIRCLLVCDINRELLTFSAILPCQVSNDRIKEFIELIVRINEIVWYGSFEYSFKHNLISHVTTLPINNASVSYEQLERLCFNNLLNVYYFQSGFEKLEKREFAIEEVFSEIADHYKNNSN